MLLELIYNPKNEDNGESPPTHLKEQDETRYYDASVNRCLWEASEGVIMLINNVTDRVLSNKEMRAETQKRDLKSEKENRGGGGLD